MSMFRTTTYKSIDQIKRRELCERILADDKSALVELASLYHDAGMMAMARNLLAGTHTGSKNHARAVIG